MTPKTDPNRLSKLTIPKNMVVILGRLTQDAKMVKMWEHDVKRLISRDPNQQLMRVLPRDVLGILVGWYFSGLLVINMGSWACYRGQ